MQPTLVRGRALPLRRNLALALSLCTSAGALHAADLAVPADFPTIQAAIDAAQPGDVVLVAPGLYPEAIDFLGKAIAVRSQAGPARTWIDGGGLPRYVVRMTSSEGPDSVLAGFTITGGAGPLSGSAPEQGGGLLVRMASPTLEDLVVTGNSGTEGGGLLIDGGAPVVHDSVFRENLALLGGGMCAKFASPELFGLSFDNNTANINGGGLNVQGGTVRLEDAQFRENVALSTGAGMWLNGTQASIARVELRENGLVDIQHGSYQFSTLAGGAIYTSNVSGRILDAIFADNAAAYGAGAYVAGGGGLQFVNTLVVGGIAAGGGGFWCNSSSPVLANCTIADNFPGGVFTTYNSFPVITNCIVARNGNENYGNVDVYGNGNAQLSYSLLGDALLAGGTLGAGMQQGDPQLDAAYAPEPGSPAIDSGANSGVPQGVKHDLAGNARFVDEPSTRDTGSGSAPIVDLGAFEFQPPQPFLGER